MNLTSVPLNPDTALRDGGGGAVVIEASVRASGVAGLPAPSPAPGGLGSLGRRSWKGGNPAHRVRGVVRVVRVLAAAYRRGASMHDLAIKGTT